jgi:hypothetical protein
MAAIRKFKFVFGGTHPAGNRFSRAAIQEQLYGFESFVDSVDQLSDEFVEKAAITLYEETLKLGLLAMQTLSTSFIQLIRSSWNVVQRLRYPR